MRLRSLLACAASASIACGSYACSDTTPSALPVYTPEEAGTEGLADTAPPLFDARTFDVAFLIDSGPPNAADTGPKPDAETDSGADAQADAPADAPAE